MRFPSKAKGGAAEMRRRSSMPSPAIVPDTGATLVELLVALAIVVLITALAAPALRNTRDRFAIERLVDGIVLTLESARADAIRRNETVAVAPGITGASTEFIFRPDGTGDGGRVIIGRGALSRVIELDASTARPRVHASR